MMSSIRLLLVHQHLILRQGLRALLDRSDDVRVTGEASSISNVIACVDGNTFDVLLTTLTLPGVAGMDLIGMLRKRQRILPILVLAPFCGLRAVQGALLAGANGYISKDCAEDELLLAIRRVKSGGRYLDSLVAEQLAFAKMGVMADAAHDRLTVRELQVLRMLGHGLRVKEIANQLALNIKTVSTHKARMMEKMTFFSTADIVSYMIANKLMD